MREITVIVGVGKRRTEEEFIFVLFFLLFQFQMEKIHSLYEIYRTYMPVFLILWIISNEKRIKIIFPISFPFKLHNFLSATPHSFFRALGGGCATVQILRISFTYIPLDFIQSSSSLRKAKAKPRHINKPGSIWQSRKNVPLPHTQPNRATVEWGCKKLFMMNIFSIQILFLHIIYCIPLLCSAYEMYV